MKLEEKFGIYGIDDERKRKVIYPTRVVLTKGKVTGDQHLTKIRPTQVAIYDYTDQCTLDNRDSDENAAVLVDFGREIHGTVTLSVWNTSPWHEVPSVDYILRVGESVSEALTPVGIKGACNDHAVRDSLKTTRPWSSNETNETGFRFAYIELTSPDAWMEIRCIQATLIYRDIEYKGSFSCSDPILGQMYDTAAYTVHLNMQRYLWDGIKRDRLVWAGDMNTELATILAVFGDNEVVRKSLDFVKDVTPVEQSMNGISAYNLWWLLCHYELYMGTGDYDYLKEQKEYLNALLLRYVTYVGEDGAEQLPGGRFFDWPTSNHEERKHAGLQGLLRLALLRGGDMMKLLSESETALKCYEAADRLLLHKPDPMGGKQSAALLAEGGIADPKEMFDRVISVDGAAGFSTFLGYFTLCTAAEAGECRAAIRLMKDYWGKMLELGATTFWEDFDISWAENASPITEPVPEGKADIHGDFGDYCYRNLRHSLCHGWASGPAPWIAKYILGIRPLEAGCKKVLFKPHLAGLQWAKGTYPTPYGNIEVDLSEKGGFCRYPDGVEVVVDLSELND